MSSTTNYLLNCMIYHEVNGTGAVQGVGQIPPASKSLTWKSILQRTPSSGKNHKQEHRLSVVDALLKSL